MPLRNRLALVAALALALLAVGAIVLAPRGGGPTAAPAARTVPAGQVGAASTVGELNTAIAAARERLRRLPKDWVTWARLGLAYVQRARVAAEPGDYQRAQEALDRSLAVRPEDNAAALTGLGALAAARHDFGQALHYGQQAIVVDAFSSAAHGVVTDALVELGRYDEAVAASQRMMDLRPDTGSYARASYLFELRGDLPAARAAMELALRVAPGPADMAFAHQHLGQLAFDAGDLATASSHVTDGLAAAPGYPPLRALRARISAARGDIPAAVAELRPVAASLPLPEYGVALGDLLMVLGDAAGAEAQYGLVRAAAKLLAASGVRTDLDLVGYAADRSILDGQSLPPAALDGARAGYAAQPSVTAADALAWALHAAGRDAEALPYADAALRLGTRHATLYYHRGMIRLGTGDQRAAAADLAEALRINPYFSLRHAPIARTTLARLGG